jgi:hypothetical protein
MCQSSVIRAVGKLWVLPNRKKAVTAAARAYIKRAMINAAHTFAWFYYFQSPRQRKERV